MALRKAFVGAKLGCRLRAWGLTVACFCKAAESPARKALQSLGDLLYDTSSDDWGPAVLAFGPVLSWPQAKLRTTRRSFCVVMGQLWRKLLYPWTQFPWKLATLIDDDQPPAAKEHCAQSLFDSPPCCLDGFARKIRELVQSPASLLDPDCPEVLQFIEAVFERIVPTSTCIERQFAKLSEWSGGASSQRKGPKPKLSTIASKHCNHAFQHSVSVWRSKTLKQARVRIHNKRPRWTKNACDGRKKNGWRLFYNDLLTKQPALRGLSKPEILNTVNQEWLRCSPASKQAWTALATPANLQAAAAAKNQAEVAADLFGGPWKVGTSSGWPLARHLIAHKCNKAKSESASFHQKFNVLQPENSESLDDSPQEPWPLFASCPVGGCRHALAEGCKATMDRLQALFWQVVFKHGPNHKAHAQEPLLLCFKSVAAAKEVMLAVTFHTRRQPLQAALLVLHKLPLPAAQGALLSLSAFAPGLERSKLELCSEATAIFSMAPEATDWTMEFLQPGPISALSRFDIMSRTPVDEAEFADSVADAAPLPSNVADVLDAFDLVHPNPSAQKRKRPRSAKAGFKKKQKMSKEEAVRTSIQQEKKLQGRTPMDSDSEPEHAIQSDDGESASVDYAGKPTKSANLNSDAEGETEGACKPMASSSAVSGFGPRPSASEPASSSTLASLGGFSTFPQCSPWAATQAGKLSATCTATREIRQGIHAKSPSPGISV